MTREEAIRICTREKDCVQGALDVCADGGHYVSPDGIITALDYVDALDMAIAALREQPQWISVEERLPDNKDHDWVLARVVEDNGFAHIPRVMEYRQNKNDWFEETYGWLSEHNGVFTVTHWMPLPSTEGLE